ncbi:hypothetical protein AGMMS50225_21650 [Betaproteobacteria bacterium]|nr:hypothetical protein AGMMS50225_21650 [Betaproteobacteria bacterium]
MLLSPDAALAANIIWDGGDGKWVTADNWSDHAVPGSGDDVRITIDVTVTIGSGESGDIGNGTFYVCGSSYNCALSITGGGTLTTGNSYVGGTMSTGTVTVDGAGSSWNLGSATLYFGDGSNAGAGVLNITDGGKVSTTSAIVAGGGSHTGTINIGAGAAAGILDAPGITGSNGTTALNFNHTATNLSPYYFTRDGLSNGTGVALNGKINLTNTARYTVLTGTDTRTDGANTITAGTTLQIGNGGIDLNAQTKALSEAFLSGAAYLNQAQDFAATQGLTAALLASGTAEGTCPRLQGFAAIGYGKMRHNTGSHIDVDGYTLLAGLAGTQDTNAGELTAAAFIEHGKGDYPRTNPGAHAALTPRKC